MIPLNVVLYQPEIPSNTGNIGRTCVAVGATLWLVRPLGFRLDDHHMRRAGLDYWEHLDVRVMESWNELRRQLSAHRFFCFSKHGIRSYANPRYQANDVLVFGSETNGLPSRLAAEADSVLRIPMTDKVRSLNLANAVAVGVYEAVRQHAELPHGP